MSFVWSLHKNGEIKMPEHVNPPNNRTGARLLGQNFGPLGGGGLDYSVTSLFARKANIAFLQKQKGGSVIGTLFWAPQGYVGTA